MKKAGFFGLLFLPAFLCFASLTLAQDNITTGNATSETRVYNTVTGEGSVYTHIETTVNGQTNTVESKNPGEIDVRNDNGKVTVIKSPNVSVTVSESENSTPTPTIKPLPHQPTFVANFLEKISNFLSRIFHNL
jgi:hypothetical protein